MIKRTFEHIGKYTLLMKVTFAKPDNHRILFRQMVTDAEKLVLRSIPIVAVISMFIGAVITIQTSLNIENPLIPKFYVGYMTRESLILEFTSTMIALILAGKVGSNISSEIGTMKISEQIDAMEIMGVNSANYLILPKIIVTTVLNPLLMLFSLMLGLIGAAGIIYATEIITISDFITGIRFSFKSYYVVYGMIKMSFFSFAITSISAFYGYTAEGGSLDVGRASTKAIVTSSIVILILNLILTQILLS